MLIPPSIRGYSRISISFIENGKRKKLYISDDEFNLNEIMMIFREFLRYEKSHRIKIEGPRAWVQLHFP
jgi:hypothetical protein